MRYQQTLIAQRHLETIEFKQKLLVLQGLNIAGLLIAAVGVWIISAIWPTFFPYTYLSWTTSLEVLYRFWPLSLWALVLSVYVSRENGAGSSRFDEEVLGWRLLTGWIAAVWEEVGFRWLFICYGMISVIVMNWLLGSVLGWGLAVLFLVLAVSAILEREALAGVLLIGAAALCATFAMMVDPLYWFYASIIMPVLNFVSLDAFAHVINPEEYLPVMVMGAIVANAWFRDGHKYQGVVGHIDSWVIGFVFMYAMFTYGLMTAIVLHGLWNTQVALFDYVVGKATRFT